MFALRVSRSGDGLGSVASDGPEIDCGTQCSASFAAGSVVRLTASPDPSSNFGGWSGACSTLDSECSVTLDEDREVTAAFDRDRVSLSVSLEGSGGGTISSGNRELACPGSCTHSYAVGSTVAITAMPDATSTFAGWTGSSMCGSDARCELTMSSAQSVRAQFSRVTFALSVGKLGSGNGTVTSTPAGIDCGASCSASFVTGTEVTLEASPAAMGAFTGWSGDCSGMGTCRVRVDQARHVDATFDFVPPVVRQLHVDVDGNGSVGSMPAGISCGMDCDQGYVDGTTVTLTATPDPGWAVVSWTGCTQSMATPTVCTVDMTSDQSVSATFYPTLIITPINARPGESVATSSPGIPCGPGCTAFPPGTAITAYVMTPSGRSANWGGCDTFSPSWGCRLMLAAPRALTATFINTFAITINVQGIGSGRGSVAVDPPSRDRVGLFFGDAVDRCPVLCSPPCNPVPPFSCTLVYEEGTNVTLAGDAGPLSYFSSWTGDCSGSPRSCVMTADRTVTATFGR